MFPLLVKLEKMNLQMEYISEVQYKYKLSKKLLKCIKLFWEYLDVFEKWWEIKVLKNDRQRFSACHLELF